MGEPGILIARKDLLGHWNDLLAINKNCLFWSGGDVEGVGRRETEDGQRYNIRYPG